MAMSLRPTSFQESSTTFNSGSAGLTAAYFFIASWAWAGNANASRTIARNGILFISFSTIEFRKLKLQLLISPAAGGPYFQVFFNPSRNCGCPALAFCARAGSDAVDTMGFYADSRIRAYDV